MGYSPIKMRKADLLAARAAAEVTELVVNGRKVVDITLTDALHKTAAKYGIAIRDVNNANRANGSGPTQVYVAQSQFDEAEFEVAGKEGELAASIYLTGNEYAAMRRWVIGKSDSGDIAIWLDGEENIIDVKIRTRPYHCCFKLTFEQWRKHCPDYYVCAQYPTDDREQVRIWGYIERSKIDALISEEYKRLWGEPLEWDYEATGAEKHVKCSESELCNLVAYLKKSSKLEKLKEKDVESGGIYDNGWKLEIAIPFTKLSPIAELRKKIDS